MPVLFVLTIILLVIFVLIQSSIDSRKYSNEILKKKSQELQYKQWIDLITEQTKKELETNLEREIRERHPDMSDYDVTFQVQLRCALNLQREVQKAITNMREK